MRSFYERVLPIVWAITAVVSFFHPGDEYALFFYSTIISSWVCAFLQQLDHPRDVVGIVMVVGIVILGVIGFVMDKLRVSKRLWGLLFVSSFAILLAYSLLQYPSLERAIGKNGSITAYVAWAVNIGLYLSIVLSLIVQGAVTAARKSKGQKSVEPSVQGA